MLPITALRNSGWCSVSRPFDSSARPRFSSSSSAVSGSTSADDSMPDQESSEDRAIRSSSSRARPPGGGRQRVNAAARSPRSGISSGSGCLPASCSRDSAWGSCDNDSGFPAARSISRAATTGAIGSTPAASRTDAASAGSRPPSSSTAKPSANACTDGTRRPVTTTSTPLMTARRRARFNAVRLAGSAAWTSSTSRAAPCADSNPSHNTSAACMVSRSTALIRARIGCGKPVATSMAVDSAGAASPPRQVTVRAAVPMCSASQESMVVFPMPGSPTTTTTCPPPC